MNYELEVSRSLPAVFDTLSSGETRRNLATNPSFEGGSTTGWAGINSTIATSIDWASVGTQSLKITPNGVSADTFAHLSGSAYTTMPPGFTAGKTYTISATGRNTAVQAAPAAQARKIVVYSWAAGNVGSGSWLSAAVANTAGATARVSVTFTIPANAVGLMVRFYNGSEVAAETVFWDAILVEEASAVANYFDGNTVASSFITYAWESTPNTSVSVQYTARPPLVAGSGTSALFGASRTIPFSAWNKGAEDQPFSLEVWHLPLTNTGELIVMGHITEGLFWDGDEYILRVIYDDDTTIESRWKPLGIKARHLVVTYDVGSFTVFADAVPVITLESLRDKPFKATGPINLNSGAGTGQYDSAAFYYRALPYSEVLAHFTWGRTITPARDISAANGGTTWSLSAKDESKYDTFIYDRSNWDQGHGQGVSYLDDVVPDVEGSGGTWRVAVPLNVMAGDMLGGIALGYDGSGISMSYSADGVNWTAVDNRSIIMQDSPITNPVLFLQFVLSPEGWLSRVVVDILSNRELSPHAGQRTLTFNSAYMDHDPENQLEYQESAGARLVRSSGSGLFVGSDGQNSGTVELWFKRNSDSVGWAGIVDTQKLDGSGGPYLGYNGSSLDFGGGSAYINGVSVANGSQIERRVWNHIVFSFHPPAELEVSVGTSRGRSESNAVDGAVAHLAVYPTALTSAQVLDLYKQNIGASILRINDASQITLSEEAEGPQFFAHNWSYVSGGS